jgi:cold shock CspA family protein
MKEWHETLGHISRDAIIRTSKAVTGMIITDTELPFCNACALSKAKKIPFPDEDPNAPCTEMGDILVGDYQGPFQQRSLGGANGISSYIDRASGFAFSIAVNTKTSVFDHFVSINERYKTLHGKSIRILRTDNNGEYKNASFDIYCKDNGIIHQFTNPHTPEQNKCAKILATLNGTNLSRALWAEVHQTMTHVHNRTVRTGCTKTPYELWTGQCPNMANLHPIGTPAFVLIPKQNQQKLLTTPH